MALAEIARLEGGIGKGDDARAHLERRDRLLRASAPNINAAREKVEEASRLRGSELEKSVPAKEHRKEVRAQLARRYQQEATAGAKNPEDDQNPSGRRRTAGLPCKPGFSRCAVSGTTRSSFGKRSRCRRRRPAADQKEPYFNTLIPWQLSVDLRRAGHKEEAEKINQAAGSNVPPPAAVLELLAQKAPGERRQRTGPADAIVSRWRTGRSRAGNVGWLELSAACRQSCRRVRCSCGSSRTRS